MCSTAPRTAHLAGWAAGSGGRSSQGCSSACPALCDRSRGQSSRLRLPSTSLPGHSLPCTAIRLPPPAHLHAGTSPPGRHFCARRCPENTAVLLHAERGFARGISCPRFSARRRPWAHGIRSRRDGCCKDPPPLSRGPSDGREPPTPLPPPRPAAAPSKRSSRSRTRAAMANSSAWSCGRASAAGSRGSSSASCPSRSRSVAAPSRSPRDTAPRPSAALLGWSAVSRVPSPAGDGRTDGRTEVPGPPHPPGAHLSSAKPSSGESPPSRAAHISSASVTLRGRGLGRGSSPPAPLRPARHSLDGGGRAGAGRGAAVAEVAVRTVPQNSERPRRLRHGSAGRGGAAGTAGPVMVHLGLRRVEDSVAAKHPVRAGRRGRGERGGWGRCPRADAVPAGAAAVRGVPGPRLHEGHRHLPGRYGRGETRRARLPGANCSPALTALWPGPPGSLFGQAAALLLPCRSW